MDYQYIKDFSKANINEVSPNGKDNFFIGEAYNYLKNKEVSVPEGFVITVKAFEYFLDMNDLKPKLTAVLSKLDTKNFSNLKEISHLTRATIQSEDLPEMLKTEIGLAKSGLRHPIHSALRLSVRYSTKNDPGCDGSLTCHHCIFFNISDLEELYKACLKCYSLLFSQDEIRFRRENGIKDFDDGVSIYVNKMVRSDLACSGILYGSDYDKPDQIRIDGSWGMSGNLIFDKVVPDMFYVSRSKLEGKIGNAILAKSIGNKDKTLIYYNKPEPNKEPTFVNIETLATKQKKYVLTDAEILQLAEWSLIIEEFYGQTMNILWAKDGLTNELFMIAPANSLIPEVN